MTNHDREPSTDDPPGGHDPAALRDAARKMHATEPTDGDKPDDVDLGGPHDRAALEDAERKMGITRPKTER